MTNACGTRWPAGNSLYQEGRDLPAEELCRDCPEILDQLKDRIWALKRTAWMTKKTSDEEEAQPEVAGDRSPKQLGEYDLQEQIGVGGMGQVFKAVHRRMERTVAIKLLPATSPRIHDEVKAAAKLIHPNIVTAFDAGEQDGFPYLVMEFVEGTDLERHVQLHGALAVEQAVRCVKEAAQGLKFRARTRHHSPRCETQQPVPGKRRHGQGSRPGAGTGSGLATKPGGGHAFLHGS